MISHVMTLANGIIGVSVLAMPFCFKQCGIILATLVLLLSSLLSRLACHFLIKSAVMSRRRNFEFLAFHAFGPMGKFLAELCIIGFLLGTCIAFFVVVGDLGPQIVGEIIDKNPENIRTSLLITTGIFIVLPLGLLKNIDSLASVSTASIAFYICLALKVFSESTHHIFAGDWFDKVYYWRIGGMLQCLPIFALALFCQTQLFEIYETMPNASLEKMNEVVQKALNICTIVYISVGIFGNIAFCNQPFTGNILMSFEPSMSSEVIKIGFVLSVAFSFPLVIFPCRASLNSLLFRRGYAHEISSSYITETRFRCLTTFIVVTSLIVGVLIPNIEFVLGIVGSTIGVIICLIFPAAFFISISTKNTNERLVAQLIVIVGVWIMVLGTYANLYAMEKSSNSKVSTPIKFSDQIDLIPPNSIDDTVPIKIDSLKPDNSVNLKDASEKPKPKVPDKTVVDNSVRKEPPVPVELIEPEKSKDIKKPIPVEAVNNPPEIKESVEKLPDTDDNKLIQQTKEAYDSLKKIKQKNVELPQKQEVDLILKQNDKNDSGQKNNDVIAVDAIKKEESELAADKEISNVDSVQRREDLDKTLESHIREEKVLMEEQKQLLKEIERQKIELDKKEEINQENAKKIEQLEKKKKSSDAKTIDQDLINNFNVTEKRKQELTIQKNKEPLIVQNEKLKENFSMSQNEIPNNKKTADLKKKERFEKYQASDSIIEKPNSSIKSILTKKSLKYSDENKNKVKNNGTVDLKNNHEPESKKNYSIPIVLKMNNQTKIPDSEHLKNHKNNANYSAMRRNILEQHQRRKREESDVPDADAVNTWRLRENNSNVDKTIEEKVCPEKSDGKSLDKIINKPISKDEIHLNNIIKESIHLSDQEIVKKVSQDSILPQTDHFISVKKRDLKALNYNGDNRKK